MQQAINWSQPQRQPFSGLLVAFLKTFGGVLKSTWPFLLLAIFRGKAKELDFYDGVLLLVLVIIFAGSIGSYFFFRFYIEADELIIKKGWLKKEVLTIPLQKIQAVHIEQSPLHQLLNIVKLSADTAGNNSTEVTIHALSKPMAEALRLRLSQQINNTETESSTEAVAPLFTLGEKDLLKLAFSANHIEAFFILLSAAYGIFDNIKTINKDWVEGADRWLPAGSVPVLIFLVTAVLVITLFISTTRIFFKFYGFTAIGSPSGIGLKSGLASTRERFVAFSKIQYISWRANWVRQRLGLWLFQYHTIGGDEVKQTMKAEVPVTQKRFISLLAQPYHSLPDTNILNPFYVHPAYVGRHTLLVGMLPALVLLAASVYWWQAKSLFFLLWPVLVAWRAWLFQKKFRVWVTEDVVYIYRGAWSKEKLLLKWDAAQTVAISQSLYQQKNGLANIKLHTAAGIIEVPYINLTLAQQVMNYSLYKVERENKHFI